MALGYLNKKVADPVLRAKLTPDYDMGCKRVLLTSNYLPALTQKNVDVITDFNPVNDSLQLSSAVFSGLAVSNGQLAASAFALDTATGSVAQVVYDSHTGALYYDSNGSGAGGSTQFAVLQGAPNLTEKQIFVV